MELFWVEQQLREHMGEVARGKGAGLKHKGLWGKSKDTQRYPATSPCTEPQQLQQLHWCRNRDELLAKPASLAHRERVVSTKHEMATEKL